MTDALLWLVITLHNLTPYAADTETACERWDRMTTIAHALDDASRRLTCEPPYAPSEARPCTPVWPASERRDLILWGVTLGWWESRFAQHVHEGRCKPHECDAHVWRDVHGRVLRVEHRARSPWQIQRHSLTEPVWQGAEGVGLVPTTKAAWGALRVVSRARGCGSDLGLVASYMRGRSCEPSAKLRPHAERRVWWHHRLRSGALPRLDVTARPQCSEAPATEPAAEASLD